MNTVNASGRLLVGSGTIKEAKNVKILTFTIETKSVSNNGDNDTKTLIPITVFNPSQELEQAIVNNEGEHCEIQGRLNSYMPDGKDGKPRLELVAYNKSVFLLGK